MVETHPGLHAFLVLFEKICALFFIILVVVEAFQRPRVHLGKINTTHVEKGPPLCMEMCRTCCALCSSEKKWMDFGPRYPESIPVGKRRKMLWWVKELQQISFRKISAKSCLEKGSNLYVFCRFPAFPQKTMASNEEWTLSFLSFYLNSSLPDMHCPRTQSISELASVVSWLRRWSNSNSLPIFLEKTSTFIFGFSDGCDNCDFQGSTPSDYTTVNFTGWFS